MKNIRWAIVLLLTLSAANTFAQYADDNVTVSDRNKGKDPLKDNGQHLDIDSVKIIKISLPDLSGDGQTYFGANISGIQILNAASDSTILGYVQTGMFNKWRPAGPDKPFTEFLQSFTDKRYQSLYKENGAKLVWVIQDIRIGERTFSMSEKSFLSFKAIAFAGDNNGQFKQVATLDTVLAKGGMDVTHKHGNNIAACLEILLNRSLVNKAIVDTVYTLAGIQERAMARYNVPALQAKEHKDGIYLTFAEFINDTPTYTDIAYEMQNNVVRFYYNDNAGNKNYVDRCWGVRKGGALLKQYYNGFIPVEQKQNSIYMTNYLSQARRTNNNVILAGVGGGLIGGAIGGALFADAVATNGMPMVENIPYMKKKGPFATRIDIETGEFTL